MKISLQTKIRILEATCDNSGQTWLGSMGTFRKADEDLLYVFQRDCRRTVLGTRLTDRISNWPYENCDSIPLSRAIMRERLRWLEHVQRVMDDRLPKIVHFGQPSRAKRKTGLPRQGGGIS